MYRFLVSTLFIVFVRVSPVCSIATTEKPITSLSIKETSSSTTDSQDQNYLEDIQNDPQWRIVGGHDCHYKFMVTVIVAPPVRRLCSGSLITPYFVLTAATCFVDLPETHYLYAVLGLPNVVQGTHTTIIIKWTQPCPDFYSHDRVDLALAYLNSAVVPSDRNMSFIKLPPYRFSDDLTNSCPSNSFTAAGWKNMNSNKNDAANLSTQLKCADIPYLRNEECEKKLERFNPKFHMCLFDPTGRKGACYADIGAPVFCNGTQYGIITDVQYCTDPRNLTFIVRVDRQMSFISRMLRTYKSCSSSAFEKLLYLTICLMNVVLNKFLN
ncbi:hypothetical protein WA026_003123 [Henosepilachna vigintioctopunctata]|uniref:Peptidase S1 domain-containing protein n=1 Tax=Henosepilachna vigintioctopunctata TaxID=420089 RepID=A0AAW1TH59_9CUCU